MAAIVLFSLGTVMAQDGSVINLDSRRELFVDRYLIDTSSGVELKMHPPTPREIVMRYDQPWEGNASGYHTIFQDGPIYRMYYNALQYGPKKSLLAHDDYIAYAESTDGIHWTRPELGLVEFNGSKKNNIIWTSPKLDNWSCFKDTNPAAKPEARYKGFHNIEGPKEELALMAVQSSDGIHWMHMTDQWVLTDGSFDSVNVAFWEPESQAYRAYYRDFRGNVRDIKTATSKDFIHWTKGEWLQYPGSAEEELYTNNVIPYYRAPHIYVGFPTRYLDRGWSEPMRLLPGLAAREARSKINARLGSALTDGLFMTSRDRKNFHRWPEAFLRPGFVDNWVYGDNYQNWGVVETKSDLPGAPNEISIYANEHYWEGDYDNLRRYTLRLDGFVSVNAPANGGEFTTHPLTFTGKELEMNFSTSVAAGIKIEIQDASGTALPGFALADCPEIFGNTVGQVVSWKGGSDLSALAGKPIRLRFVMKDADLYAIRFR